MLARGSRVMKEFNTKSRSKVDAALTSYLSDIEHAAHYGKTSLHGLLYNYSDIEASDLRARLNLLGYNCTYTKQNHIAKFMVSWYA